MIKTKEDALFARWMDCVPQGSGTIFVTDGMVDEEKWKTANRKVLYLLKEVNGAENSWDERDYLKNYHTDDKYIATHSQTINNLIRWQYILSGRNVQSWKGIEQSLTDKKLQNELLSELCLVNLKKTAGGGIMDWRAFETFWENEENRKYLIEQLSLYNPDYIICGGTAHYFSALYGISCNEWEETSRGIRYIKNNKTICIDYCHPNNRGPKNLICFGLLDTILEIEGKG